jgi:putative ABC transport system substrate-binding protein
MKRREFITLLGGAAAACPMAARAQQVGPMRRAGVLMDTDETEPVTKAILAAFVQGLRNLGWIDGQNLRIDTRWVAGEAERSRTFATDLLRLSPDVIFSAGTANLEALLRQGPAMPIIFIKVSDPVAQGFVSNLAHPGGNITGFAAYEFSIGAKWIDLLKQIAPGLSRGTVIFNPDTAPQSKFFLASIQAAAPSLGVELMPSPVHDAADIEQAIESASHRPNDGLLFPTDAFLTAHRELIVEAAARRHLPAMYPTRLFTAIGGLMSYAVDFESQSRQAAIYLDRILKGAKPGDLPVQFPTKYNLVINLKTAKVLGLNVPLPLRGLADEMIE